ncbi:metal-dependent hydrolase [Jeotgalibacillus sp. R-1-5s-1]|uniref:metal-dependent hydrolase n=1 Tax=Jeotgalibacillus sp. R-1-5s-1 TaxID=2555897 RepID=UPI00106B9AC7|nr:metal-dependent hydrolase [Jeotgalibacillus sp. R-1-5s-1]TFE01245.1 metal-dependent hydrolase [Jeotgalibacillus sp. R-1-5s-1]
MDTGTHIVMGFAIGGLAAIDPVVANDPATAQSVLIAVVIGSQAPDADTVLKLRNNAVYIRHHRGITHSIPAVMLWPIAITAAIYPFFPEANLLHLWLWTFLAVFLHVFVDIFNSYGTQALRPFSSKWVALGVINTFDPIIFGIHVIGLMIWGFGADPVPTFLIMYAIIAGYYVIRFMLQSAVRSSIRKRIPDAENVIIAPTIRFYQWRIAAETKEHFYVGRAYGRSVTIYDKFKRKSVPDNEIFAKAKTDKNVSAFLSFSPLYRWELVESDDQYEVRFIDLRYRSNDHYPFVAVVQMDKEFAILSSYTGWIFSEEKLQKKLDFLPNE